MPEDDLISLEEAIKKVAVEMGISFDDAEKIVLTDVKNGVLPILGKKV